MTRESAREALWALARELQRLEEAERARGRTLAAARGGTLSMARDFDSHAHGEALGARRAYANVRNMLVDRLTYI